MPSSTSPSEPPFVPGVREGALPPGLRRTASDRPGQAQPVPTRDVPSRPWPRLALAVVVIVALLVAGWEWSSCARGFRAGDIDDSMARWTAERDKVSPGRDKVVLVSDSRLLFGTDLERFARLTGARPLQLGVVGSSALVLLQDIAADRRFNGLLVVGLAETSYFGRPGLAAAYLKARDAQRLPSRRTRLWLGDAAERSFAFISGENRLSVLLQHADTGLRRGAPNTYDDVWKVAEQDGRRQYRMWRMIETDPYLRAHAIRTWHNFNGKSVPRDVLARTIADTVTAVAAIRARGGDVVFVRPPSSPLLRNNEERRVPKAKGWDALLAATHTRGIHADDLGVTGWNLPERSHLSRACATVYTDMYVRRLATLTDRLTLRSDAPPPLALGDCLGVGAGAPARGS